MNAGPNQQRRLLELLDKLSKAKRGDPETLRGRDERAFRFDVSGMDGQEHRDVITLFHAGHIDNPSMFGGSPVDTWSSAGIYAYEITADGEEYLEANRYLLQDEPEQWEQTVSSRSRVFIIHGTDPNGYVPQVESVCRQIDLEPVRMMEEPNRGMGLAARR